MVNRVRETNKKSPYVGFKLFANLGIAKKLILILLLLSLIWAVLCSVSITYIMNVKDTYSKLLQGNAAALAITKEIQYNVANQNYALQSYNMTTAAGAVSDTKSITLLHSSNENINQLVLKALNLVGEAEDRPLLEKIRTSNKEFKSKSDEVIKTLETNRVKAQVIMQNEVNALSFVMISASDDIAARQQEKMSTAESLISKQIHKWITIIISGGSITFIGAMVGSYWIACRMTRPLVEIVGKTEKIAAGNLNVGELTVVSGDEIGQLSHHFHEMSGNLRNIIVEIAHSSNEIASTVARCSQGAASTAVASKQIAENMQEVQSFLGDQLENVGATNRSAAEMLIGIQQIALNTLQTAERAQSMYSLSICGLNEMMSTAEQMNTIQGSVQHLQGTIASLGDKTGRIGNMIEVISQIARQTNILALNASIEAARAGSNGGGFAVIANEVRQLALKTSQSADEINLCVQEIIRESRNTVQSVEESINEVELGAINIERAKETFNSINEAITANSKDIQEVSLGAQVIETLTGQVVQAIGHIESLSKQFSEVTQEVAAATEQQLASIEEMEHSIHGLTLVSHDLGKSTHRFSW